MIRFAKGVVASMSLERKCLLFFGSALLVLMFVAFLVVEKLGRELVKNVPLNRASDYSTHDVQRRHVQAILSQGTDPQLARENRMLLEEFKKSLWSDDEDQEIDYEIVGIDSTLDHQDLPPIGPIEDPAERELLRGLEIDYRRALAIRLAKVRPDVATPLDLAENAPLSQIGPGSGRPHRKIGPIDGKGVYYMPIFFTPSCMTCHTAGSGFSHGFAKGEDTDPQKLAAQYPFRVGKVTMPYRQTYKHTSLIRAVLVALGMLIVAITLFVLHAIVRHLVLVPMYHLRDVSDQITRGQTDQRAVIETDDEFRELADAFNRMLRHMTETNDQIKNVNQELDARVDQLAQLNLQLYENNRLKSDFLANMSHELRTPLNSIIGFSEVLQGIDSLSDKQRRYASNIQKSGRLLLEMINDILDLAKVEAGKMEVRTSEFDLSRLIHAQCDMMLSLVEEKKLALEIQLPGNLRRPKQDANKLGQILNNLLSNAIKFTPEGGLITVAVAERSSEVFEMRVSDTGVGIAEEDQNVIFEKFRQSKKVLDGDGLTREYSGTGLGLSIVKELAKLLGGEVGFESELGRGSAFWVTIPWQMPSESETLRVAS
ncbi:MAG: ATP-binding protein [Planctomycetota bacterium]